MKHTTLYFTRFLVAAVLMLSGSVMVQAQEIEDGEAFYIYRNDGDFNGFFYDQVEEMRYSRLDLDGVEHDEYVVQEVVTTDSIYRIPLAAIDSVGFVQPDIILNPRLKNLDEVGISDYVEMYDAKYGTIWLYSITPEDLLPEVGDVLVSFDAPVYNPSNDENYSGIGRKVTGVNYIDGVPFGHYQITTDPLEKMSDIFVQFISVEEVSADDAGNAQRRVAGMNTLPYRKAAGGFSKTLVDASLSPHLTFYPSKESSISLDINLGVKIALGMVYQIRGDDFFIKALLAEDLSVSAGVTMKVNTGGEEAIPVLPDGMTSLKFPAFCPLFEVRPAPKGFIRYQGELYAKATLPEMSTGLRQSFTIDSDDPYLMSFNFNERKQEPAQPNELIDVGDVNIGWNGFVQCGTKSDIGIYTNSWFSTIFTAYLGVDVYSGPKLEGNVNISAAALANGDGAYSLRDSHFTFTPYSIDFEAKGYLSSLWGKDNIERTFFDGNLSFGSKSLWMFPTFTAFSAQINEDNTKISTTTQTDERMVFWGSQIGAGLFNQYEDVDNPTVEFHTKRLFPLTTAPKYFNTTLSITKPGYYKVMPVLKTLDYLIPIKSMAQEFLIKPYIKLSPTKIKFPWQGGKVEVDCLTNGTQINTGFQVEGKKIIIESTENHELFARGGGQTDISASYIIHGKEADIAVRSPYAQLEIEQEAAPASIYKYVGIEDDFPGPTAVWLLPGGRVKCNASASENRLSVTASGSENRDDEFTDAKTTVTYNVHFEVDITQRDSCVVTGGHVSCKWVTTGTDSGKPYINTKEIDFSIVNGTPGIGGLYNVAEADPCVYVESGSGGGLARPYRHEYDKKGPVILRLYRTEKDNY